MFFKSLSSVSRVGTDEHNGTFAVLTHPTGSLYAYLDAVAHVKNTLMPVKKVSFDLVYQTGYQYLGDASKNFTGATRNVLTNNGEICIMFNNVYGNYQKENHPIAQRNEMLAELYLQYKSDVLGLQECSPYSRSAPSLVEILSKEYAEVPIIPNNSDKTITHLCYIV